MICTLTQMPINKTLPILNKMEKGYNQSSLEADNYIEEPWDIIGSYFKGKHLKQLVKHQIESYNMFVEHQIPQTIEMFNPIHVKTQLLEIDENCGEIVTRILERIEVDTARFTMGKDTFTIFDFFCSLWKYIDTHEYKEEILKILIQQFNQGKQLTKAIFKT